MTQAQEEPKKDIAVFQFNLFHRGLNELRDELEARAHKLFGCNIKALGLNLPENFLLPGSQPLMGDLTVLANKLRLQIQVTTIRIMPIEDIMPKAAAQEPVKKE